MTSAFPLPRDEWKNPEAEARMELLMGVITGIRNIRSEAEVHPSNRIDAFVNCPDDGQRQIISGFTRAISDMTRLQSLTVMEKSDKPDDAGTYIFNDIEIYVPLMGLIDVAAEMEKLGRERKKVEDKLKQVNGNSQFLANAPEAVVAKVQEEKDQLDGKLATIAEAEERLRKIG
jgi:valyl-tRNA synthetase